MTATDICQWIAIGALVYMHFCHTNFLIRMHKGQVVLFMVFGKLLDDLFPNHREMWIDAIRKQNITLVKDKKE